MATTPFLTTLSGTATSFVPLATAWSSANADCAQAIYAQVAGNFLAWDPWYVHYIDQDLTTCWPPQASSWWNQDTSPTTSLGPAFVCPSAYHAAYTSSVDSHTTKTICCPSGYDLYVAEFEKPSFPSQCTSTLTAGDTLSWEQVVSEGVTWTPATTTVQSETLTIYGIPVNGLNVIATSTTTSSSKTASSGSTSSSGSVDAGTGTSTSAGTVVVYTGTPTPDSQKHTIGVAVGASVGTFVGLVLIATVAFLLWRRKKRSATGRNAGTATGYNNNGQWSGGAPAPVVPEHMRHVAGYHTPVELKAGQTSNAHEMATDGVAHVYELPAERRDGTRDVI
ncbi:hypothetical protein VPNG_02612 [Cytospora leucostoma]|uniref:Uncharacterized protein n=1 Tax=Cytospora leucostoma TaxID=1230097 RepID=A0A423XIC8_9PEZI|nr:hypothetical protein VPNG_02612 [Cytospora leucostoma]